MGRQAYVICPMVEESEGLEAENVTDYARKLQEILPGEIKVEILHGKMKPKRKTGSWRRLLPARSRYWYLPQLWRLE